MKEGTVFSFALGRLERRDSVAYQELIEVPHQLVTENLYALGEDGLPQSLEAHRGVLAELDAIYNSYNWEQAGQGIDELIEQAVENICSLSMGEGLLQATAEGQVLEAAHPVVRAACKRVYNARLGTQYVGGRLWCGAAQNITDTILARNILHERPTINTPVYFDLRTVQPKDSSLDADPLFVLAIQAITNNFPLDAKDALEVDEHRALPFVQTHEQLRESIEKIAESHPQLYAWLVAHAKKGLIGLQKEVLYDIQRRVSVLQHPLHIIAATELLREGIGGFEDHVRVTPGTVFLSIDHYLSLGSFHMKD